jgi:hypothetical protein
MKAMSIATASGFALAAATFAFVTLPIDPAAALTMKECSAKYQAAQKAGTLKGMKWNDYRKAECGEGAASATPAAATTTAKASSAVYPKTIDSKYSKESPGKARLKTCTDQYNANKVKNANGGMKWIEKGGGYWSACNKALKG